MRSRRTRSTNRGGFTLVELLVAVTILSVGVSLTANTLVSTGRIVPMNRDSARALDGALSVLEEIRGVGFDEVFARYNDDPADDPDGPGTAPGRHFAVEGLRATAADLDGLVGRIEFPEAGGELREDFDDVRLGMPRDLDLDEVVDTADHATNYAVLPFRVRLDWRSNSGDRSFEVHYVIVRP